MPSKCDFIVVVDEEDKKQRLENKKGDQKVFQSFGKIINLIDVNTQTDGAGKTRKTRKD